MGYLQCFLTGIQYMSACFLDHLTHQDFVSKRNIFLGKKALKIDLKS